MLAVVFGYFTSFHLTVARNGNEPTELGSFGWLSPADALARARSEETR